MMNRTSTLPFGPNSKVSEVLRAFAIVVGMLLIPAMADAQSRVPASSVLIIDSERLYAESAFGMRVLANQQAEAAVLAAEYRRIEAELTEEERDLTEKRPTMASEEFRKLADAFDMRVETIRATQQQREDDIIAQGEAERQRFFAQIAPVLEVVLSESGAVVVLEKRSVFASSNALDVTDRVIAQANAMFGDGRIEDDDLEQVETEQSTAPTSDAN